MVPVAYKDKMHQIVYESPVGQLFLAEQAGEIRWIKFSPLSGSMTTKETAVLKQAKQQLDAYFAGELRLFDLPLAPQGTDFQKRVWQGLMHIPYGETCSYKTLAEAVGSPKGYRAVGMANNRNPISIVIPCHRVIGANGALVGYGGGLEKKEILLSLEKSVGQDLPKTFFFGKI